MQLQRALRLLTQVRTLRESVQKPQVQVQVQQASVRMLLELEL